MNSKLKIITLSDLHLEKKSQDQAQFILKLINERVQKEKENNFIPLVTLVGDIHNGVKSYDWMKDINAPVLYVAGNHEFWDGDFYEVSKELESCAPKNVTYLNNKAVLIEDTIFLGATLWTDVGQNTNPDILYHCAFTMNDSFYIKAKDWYKKEININRINQLMGSRAEDFINENLWNVLAEIDENLKSQEFLKSFDAIHDLFTQVIPKEKSHLDFCLKTSYESITKKEHSRKIENLMSYQDANTLKEYLENNNYFNKEYNQNEVKKILKEENDFNENLFNQFKNIPLEDKKIVVISHHLPFVEETLVGHHRAYKNRNGTTTAPIINNVNDKVFLINKGEDYPFFNYFRQCSKGELKKEEDITKVSHYCNAGSKIFDYSFLSKIDVWLHGHEHGYNYIDYLKGIKIACNPMGYALNGLVFENGKLQITQEFTKKYPEQTKAKWLEHLNNIKEEVIQEVMLPEKNKDKSNIDTINAWVWFLWDKEKYLRDLRQTILVNKKLFGMISKKIQNQKYDQYQINLHGMAINSLLSNLNAQEQQLLKALRVRIDGDFSFEKEAYGLTKNQSNRIFSVNMNCSYGRENLQSHWLEQEFDLNPFSEIKEPNSYGLKELYFNTIHMNYAFKKVEQIKSLFENCDFSSPQDISQEVIKNFVDLNEKLEIKDLWKMSDKMQSKYYKVLEGLKNKNTSTNSQDTIHSGLNF